MPPIELNLMYFFTGTGPDPTGFTPITENPMFDGLYQCSMCFGVVLSRTPINGTFAASPIDGFQHHRNNCYGWQKGR